ncbi:hypothetical protein BBBGCB_BBBGCB_13030, partial [Dysosmobacter welbionis]
SSPPWLCRPDHRYIRPGRTMSPPWPPAARPSCRCPRSRCRSPHKRWSCPRS